jgi:hypothetical protein
MLIELLRAPNMKNLSKKEWFTKRERALKWIPLERELQEERLWSSRVWFLTLTIDLFYIAYNLLFIVFFKGGMYANLGIGLPMLVADLIPKNMNVVLHAENGILGLVR